MNRLDSLFEDPEQLEFPQLANYPSQMMLLESFKEASQINSFTIFDHDYPFSPSEPREEVKNYEDHSDSVKKQSTLKKNKKNGCICKKTRCLKMYCQCFSQGKTCTEDCACFDCSNHHQNTKGIQQAKGLVRLLKTDRIMQGCRCKKTRCQKKYCECFENGRKCTQLCKCCNCENFEGGCSTEQQLSPEILGQLCL